MMYGYGFGLVGMILSLVVTVVILGGLAWLVIWAVRRTSGGQGLVEGSARAQTPKEVLQMRYARGEITREQYQQMSQDLDH